ncbi:MAG: hypothetical protein HQM15_03925 [Deltaproteobacteria bacterium]|nr:hypothetical protein [Deltaproteobacteria bacterium]
MKKIMGILLLLLSFTTPLKVGAQESASPFGMAVFYSKHVRVEVKLNDSVINNFSAPCTMNESKFNEKTQKQEEINIELENCMNLLPFAKVSQHLKKGENILEVLISPLMYKGKNLIEYLNDDPKDEYFGKKTTAVLVSVLDINPKVSSNPMPWTQYRKNAQGKMVVETAIDPKDYKILISLEWYWQKEGDALQPVTLTKKFNY